MTAENIGSPERRLAAAVLAAAADPAARAELEGGRVPVDLGDRAASYAASRSNRSRWVGGLTPVLQVWLGLGLTHARANDGKPPTVTELAAAAGRSRTAAHGAIVRLRQLGRWPPPVTDTSGEWKAAAEGKPAPTSGFFELLETSNLGGLWLAEPDPKNEKTPAKEQTK